MHQRRAGKTRGCRLEIRLGLKLFTRERQRLVITEAGCGYLVVVRDAFDRIAMGTERLLQRQTAVPLTVTTSPDFAAKWLVHRLGLFAEAHPDIDLRVSATMHQVLNRDSMAIDAAVDGQGNVLARATLASWDLLAGRLVMPLAESLKLQKTYWIVCTKTSSKLPKVITFGACSCERLPPTNVACVSSYQRP